MRRIICIVALLLFLPGCIAIPVWVEESVHDLHGGGVIICEDYVELAMEKYEGEELQNKLLIVDKFLKLSKELDVYVQGKGGKLKLPAEGKDGE